MKYIIPFKKRPIKIGQSFNEGSQEDWPEDSEDMTYSIDFLLPEGKEAYKNHTNEIEIKHGDGTYASYSHPKHKGSFVKVGEKVKQGQKIGLSGNTGWSPAPHLDFSVFRKNYKNRKIKTIKFSFKHHDLY